MSRRFVSSKNQNKELENQNAVKGFTHETLLSEQNAEDLDQLREVTASLIDAVKHLQNQQSQRTQLQKVADEVKSAALAMAQHTAASHPAPQTAKSCKTADDHQCPQPCSCVSESCCSFDIIMTHARVLHMQMEPQDSNIDNIEVRMFASINGIGAVIPNMFSVLTLHKLVSQPGVWTQINQRIGTVDVTKSSPKTLKICVDAVEVEDTIMENMLALRDEYGTGYGSMTLDCCCTSMPIVCFDIHFTGGGNGYGAISVQFTAEKKC